MNNKNVKEDINKLISKYGMTAILREITILLMVEAGEIDRIEKNGGDFYRRAANKVWNGMLARCGARSDVVLKGTEVVE